MTGKRNHRGNRVGEWHHRAKLSDAAVRAIRAEYRKGVKGMGYSSLARRYGVAWATVRDVVTWRTRASA